MTFLFSESGDADFFDSWLLPPWMLDRGIFRSDLFWSQVQPKCPQKKIPQNENQVIGTPSATQWWLNHDPAG